MVNFLSVSYLPVHGAVPEFQVVPGGQVVPHSGEPLLLSRKIELTGVRELLQRLQFALLPLEYLGLLFVEPIWLAAFQEWYPHKSRHRHCPH